MARKLVAVRADSAVVRMFTKLAKSSGSGFLVPTLREVVR